MFKKEIWLKEAHSRFCEQGISGINIDEISRTIGVAKTSFYHFFKSKEKFLEHLFERWIYNGTTRIWDEVKHISDPVVRMEKLITIVLKSNIEEEIFNFQMRAAANKSPIAKRYLGKSDKLRGKIVIGFFTDMGFNQEESVVQAEHFTRYFVGRIDTNNDIIFNDKEIIQFIKDIKYILRINN